ncbi:CDP-alcohol phosphatidyltransferase family protein [Sphingomonas sp. RB56-2]|uniref:CDP-alcohol phosphatidyltransferase family protein n=1 Tax=Sphingomonas brevis TaxID=2908206 RepID=A0ABT0SAW4_9SPHN|nr:CDP-alcohol phosphatidyltransferase family protein [Sphingomonas brevis]MCL6741216.1 CDP-alcohol phosphatidyltransferase family protein [Sphingomonas brevis]
MPYSASTMTNDAASAAKPLFVTVGDNPARAFGMSAADRANAMAVQAGLEPGGQPSPGRSTVYADLNWAWDPEWLGALAEKPGGALVKNGHPVLANVPAGGDPAPLLAAMLAGDRYQGALEQIDADTTDFSYRKLRKRERPFVMPLDPADPEPVERAAYDASYKGVTDVLTLYLWRRLAFYLTRWAAQAGMTPNTVTAIGFALCAAAFFLFMYGWYWTGIAAGFGFMVLDTVDGKLARCTGQSSHWGNIFDHGVDLVHPPFWWWAWAEGLEAYGRPFERVYELLIVGAIVFGYVAQRVIEGIFVRRYGMHIHVWQQVDSRFRLITARRNPNMVILVAALLVGRPDLGIELVALWTILSLIFHAVRLAQANARHDRGRTVTSWLA